MNTQTIYPKHYILINGIKIDVGNDINVEYDLNNTYYTGSFEIPSFTDTKSSKLIPLSNLQYLDSIKIYYKEFTSYNDMINADYADMDLIVNGFIADVNTAEDKSSGLTRNVIFKSSMGLAYETSMMFDLPADRCANTILNGLAMNALIPTTDKTWDGYLNVVEELNKSKFYIYNFSDDYNILKINKVIFDEFTHHPNFIIKANPTINFGEMLDTIKKNHTIKIFQLPNGDLNITTPVYFYNRTADVLQFDAKINIQNITFGGLNNLYNAVMVHGTGAVGFAFDPISYELSVSQDTNATENDKFFAEGTLATDGRYKKGFVPNIKYLRIKHLFRRDIFDDFTAYNIAINELYELSKSSTVTFETIYSGSIKVGQLFNIKNSLYLKNLFLDKSDYPQDIADNLIWIIKNVKLKISKNNITAIVEGYRNAISDFPAEYITPSSGLSMLDVNYLSSVEKANNLTKLH